jgi:hypothetical protein
MYGVPSTGVRAEKPRRLFRMFGLWTTAFAQLQLLVLLSKINLPLA